jgi:hypothetical protein
LTVFHSPSINFCLVSVHWHSRYNTTPSLFSHVLHRRPKTMPISSLIFPSPFRTSFHHEKKPAQVSWAGFAKSLLPSAQEFRPEPNLIGAQGDRPGLSSHGRKPAHPAMVA